MMTTIQSRFDEITSKACFKCGDTKPRHDFYKHPDMADGRLGKCKECTKADVKARTSRMKHNPELVKQERKRCREKQERYRNEGVAIQSSYKSKDKWRKSNMHKSRAHCAARRANKTPPLVCEHCRKPSKIMHRHHPDYSKPKKIVWMCPKCHGLEHRKDK